MKQPSLIGNALVSLYASLRKAGRPATQISSRPANISFAPSSQLDPDAGGGGGAPDDAQYLTLAANATLTAERVFTPGSGLSGVDGGAGSTYTLNNVVAKSSTYIEPVTAGDNLRFDTLVGGSGSGDDLTLSSTSHGTKGDVQITDGSRLVVDGALDGQLLSVENTSNTSNAKAIKGYVSGASAGTVAVVGVTASNGDNARGILGQATAATGATIGVYGVTASSDNDAYSIYAADRTYLGNWADLDEQGSNPASPESTNARIFTKAGAAAGSWLYMKSDTATVHDLGAQHKETFWAAGGKYGASGEGSINLAYTDGQHPDAAGAATVTFGVYNTFSTPGTESDPCILLESDAIASWTSVTGGVGRPPDQQSYVAFAAPARNFSGDGGTTGCKAARISCRLMMNDVSLFGKIQLTISDVDGSNKYSYECTGASDNTWQEFASGIVDISSYVRPLRLSVTFMGSDSEFGDCIAYLEYIALELWAE